MINEAIISVILALFVAEVAKILVQVYKKKHVTFFELGGMPSTHAAVVAALFLAVYLETGVSIPSLICAVFGMIVLRDAYGVRWEVSRHSDALNKIGSTKQYLVVGHKEIEVIVGLLLGFGITILVYLV